MLIAEQVMHQGMAAADEFTTALTDLVANKKLTRIIETGTYQGTGTTRAIVNGIFSHGLHPNYFISIESDTFNFTLAKHNNRHNPVTILRGLSVPRTLLPKAGEIEFTDFPDDVVVDHPKETRTEKYYTETNKTGTDDLLPVAFKMMPSHPELIVLDSAGHIGLIEFNYVMSLVKENFYLALDDTHHVKHYKTVKQIENDQRFTEVFATNQKFGSKIYSVQIR